MDNRIPLPKGDILTIVHDGSVDSLKIDKVIGRGGSCLVYKGTRTISINDTEVDSTVIIKEFYPVGIDINRLSDNSLQINDQASFEAFKAHFAEGQSRCVEFYEYYLDYSLPRVFLFGEANNTVYAISDPAKGKTLSEIDFENKKLELSHIASIMESICIAISKIHIKKKLYLDCKPDNFFYYHDDNDIQSKVYLFDFDTIVDLEDIKNGKYAFCSASESWVPKEQVLEGNRYSDPQGIGYHTDIYSIGAIFFWLLIQREPTHEDLNRIQAGTFDWEQESKFCRGKETEVIKQIQDIAQASLQPDTATRKKMFRHYIAIRAVRDQYKTLYGLTVGDDVHFEPIHEALKRVESELLAEAEQIKTEVRRVSTQVDDLRKDIAAAKKPEKSTFAKGTAINRFQYNAETTAFYGRESELAYLREMCCVYEKPFCWTGICGPGGSGKSRLAYQLCIELEEKGWKVFPPSHVRVNAERIKTELNSTDKDVLVCFDDANVDTDMIIDFIYYCAESLSNDNRVRLIVIDRDFPEFVENTNVSVYSYSRPFGSGLDDDGYGKFIALKKTPEIRNIIKDFAFRVYQKQMSEDDEQLLMETLKRVDDLERPLFALFICDAWCSGNDIEKWNKKDALDMVVSKEYERAMSYIKMEYAKKSEQSNALQAFCALIMFSSFIKPMQIELISEYVYESHRIDVTDDSFQWVLSRLGLNEQVKLENYLPDIICEYISLKYINSLTLDKSMTIITMLMKNDHLRTLFIGTRIVDDYYDLLIAPTNMSIFQYFWYQLDDYVLETFKKMGIYDEFVMFEDDDPEFDMWLANVSPNFRDGYVLFWDQQGDYYLKNYSGAIRTGQKEYEEGFYSGSFLFDWRCGKGRFTTNKFVYDGDWNGDCINGHGKMMILSDGSVYDGDWEWNVRSGHGVMTWPEGAKYDGDWKEGKRNGHGVMTWPDGSVYDGDWKEGKRNGHGVMTWPNGSVYDGEWNDNQADGHGTFKDKDGCEYDGEWKDGKLI